MATSLISQQPIQKNTPFGDLEEHVKPVGHNGDMDHPASPHKAQVTTIASMDRPEIGDLEPVWTYGISPGRQEEGLGIKVEALESYDDPRWQEPFELSNIFEDGSDGPPDRKSLSIMSSPKPRSSQGPLSLWEDVIISPPDETSRDQLAEEDISLAPCYKEEPSVAPANPLISSGSPSNLSPSLATSAPTTLPRASTSQETATADPDRRPQHVTKRRPRKSSTFHIAVPNLPRGVINADYSPLRMIPYRHPVSYDITSNNSEGNPSGQKRKRNETRERNSPDAAKRPRVSRSKLTKTIPHTSTFATTPLPITPLPTNPSITPSDTLIPPHAPEFKDSDAQNHYEKYVYPPHLIEFPNILATPVYTPFHALLISTRHLRKSLGFDLNPYPVVPKQDEMEELFPKLLSHPLHDFLDSPDVVEPLPHPQTTYDLYSDHSSSNYFPEQQNYVPSIDDAIFDNGDAMLDTFHQHYEDASPSGFNGTVDPSLLGGIEQYVSPISSPRASPSHGSPFIKQGDPSASTSFSRSETVSTEGSSIRRVTLLLSDSKPEVDDVELNKQGNVRMYKGGKLVNPKPRITKTEFLGDDSNLAGPSKISPLSELTALSTNGDFQLPTSSSLRGGRGRGRGRRRGRGRGGQSKVRETPTSESGISTPQPSQRDRSNQTERHVSKISALVPVEQDKVYCHQCRNSSWGEKMTCANIEGGHSCGRRYCVSCIIKRYPDIEFDAYATMFVCPSCTDTCNCTQCCKKRGEEYITTRYVKVDKKILAQISAGELPGKLPSASAEFVRRMKELGRLTPGSSATDMFVHSHQSNSKQTQPKASTNQPKASGSNYTAKAIEKTQKLIERTGDGSGSYWGAVFSVTGDRIGAGFIGDSAKHIILKPGEERQTVDDTAKRKRSRYKMYIGRSQESWGFNDSGEELEPEEFDVSRKGKGKAGSNSRNPSGRRQFVGKRPVSVRPKSRQPSWSPLSPLTPLSIELADPDIPPENGPAIEPNADDETEDEEKNHWIVDQSSQSLPDRQLKELSQEQIMYAIGRAIQALNVGM